MRSSMHLYENAVGYVIAPAVIGWLLAKTPLRCCCSRPAVLQRDPNVGAVLAEYVEQSDFRSIAYLLIPPVYVDSPPIIAMRRYARRIRRTLVDDGIEKNEAVSGYFLPLVDLSFAFYKLY